MLPVFGAPIPHLEIYDKTTKNLQNIIAAPHIASLISSLDDPIQTLAVSSCGILAICVNGDVVFVSG